MECKSVGYVERKPKSFICELNEGIRMSEAAQLFKQQYEAKINDCIQYPFAQMKVNQFFLAFTENMGRGCPFKTDAKLRTLLNSPGQPKHPSMDDSIRLILAAEGISVPMALRVVNQVLECYKGKGFS